MNTPPYFGHVVTAMVTPFDKNLQVDDNSVRALVEHLISTGTSAIVVAGTTGESVTLSHDEKVHLFSLVKEVAKGRVTVIAGTGSNNTADTIALTEDAQLIGVDAHLVVTPYYNKPSQEGLIAHYTAVAASTNLPVILYNVPGRTAVNLTAASSLQLAAANKNIVAVKEASKDLEQIGNILAKAPEGFQVYSGDDGTTLPILALGGSGVVSVTSHVNGKQLARLHESWFAGDITSAQRLHLDSLALTKALFVTSNPVPVKHALKLLGVLPHDHVRLPLVSVTTDESEIILAALKQYGLL